MKTSRLMKSAKLRFNLLGEKKIRYFEKEILSFRNKSMLVQISLHTTFHSLTDSQAKLIEKRKSRCESQVITQLPAIFCRYLPIHIEVLLPKRLFYCPYTE